MLIEEIAQNKNLSWIKTINSAKLTILLACTGMQWDDN
jgi:hypothetical protein